MSHEHLDIGIVSVVTVIGITVDLFRGRRLLTGAGAKPLAIFVALALETLILGLGILSLIIWHPSGLAYGLTLAALWVVFYAVGWAGDIARERLGRR